MDYKDELIKALQKVIEMQDLEIERLKQNQLVLAPEPYRPNQPFWVDIKPPMYGPPIVTCETGSGTTLVIDDGKQTINGKEQLEKFNFNKHDQRFFSET